MILVITFSSNVSRTALGPTDHPIFARWLLPRYTGPQLSEKKHKLQIVDITNGHHIMQT